MSDYSVETLMQRFRAQQKMDRWKIWLKQTSGLINIEKMKLGFVGDFVSNTSQALPESPSSPSPLD
jgi:hypothetical protein